MFASFVRLLPVVMLFCSALSFADNPPSSNVVQIGEPGGNAMISVPDGIQVGTGSTGSIGYSTLSMVNMTSIGSNDGVHGFVATGSNSQVRVPANVSLYCAKFCKFGETAGSRFQIGYATQAFSEGMADGPSGSWYQGGVARNYFNTMKTASTWECLDLPMQFKSGQIPFVQLQTVANSNMATWQCRMQ